MMDYPTSSPPLPAETFAEKIDTLSLKDKESYDISLMQHNNNNINKGYLTDGAPDRPGTRGRKTFAFWVLVGLLFTLAIGNLILTITILGVLKLGQGMRNMEIIYNENVSNFYGDIDLDHLYNKDGTFLGFSDETVDISAVDSSVILTLQANPGDGKQTSLKMFKNYTFLRGISRFLVKSANGVPIFTTTETVFESLEKAKGFITRQMETGQIRSGKDESLSIESDKMVNLKGTEGSKIEGREIVWSADEDIYLKTVNGCIILSGKEGTYIDVNRIPVAQLRNNTVKSGQYKICVCMPEGKLFRIPIIDVNEQVYCDDVDVSGPGFPCAVKE